MNILGGRVVYNVAKAMCESESKSVKEEAKGKVKMKERVNNWGKKMIARSFDKAMGPPICVQVKVKL